MNLHRKPFDEGTIAKLEIFEDYAQAWIPTFVMSGHKSICIFDFFAGTGYDSNGIPGSPIRILSKIREQIGNIFKKSMKVTVHFNEYNKKKFKLLKVACDEYFEKYPEVKRAISIHFYNEDFDILFHRLYPLINSEPSLVYLDQNGVKYLSEKYLLKLEQTNTTDFLYFISSSYFLRFGETDEFEKHFNIDLDRVRANGYNNTHKSVMEQVQEMLPNGSSLKLYPFSIKKGPNIYGIIFGAKHIRAVDKFLKATWKRNETNGEANYDIDEDEKKIQLVLDFDNIGAKRKTKLEQFEDNLTKNILDGTLKSNEDVLYYCYDNGHIAQHATKVLRQLKKDGFIHFKGQPLVRYENVFKKPSKIIHYQILKK